MAKITTLSEALDKLQKWHFTQNQTDKAVDECFDMHIKQYKADGTSL